ncbi:acyl-CoA dehydrogenase family protein [Trinickia sp. NRRL B-1857]|uniref:acyl-CoA dehydrogenase family protein n=1 Tax=Trinickia sp. NRRL B-1857 TaxID=3162879 RepID=UPI003D2B36AE
MNLAANVSSPDVAAKFRGIAESFRHRTPRGAFAWDTWQALSDAGLWRLPVPEKLGGTGGSWTQFVDAFEAIVATLRSVGFAMALANQATLIRALLAHGTPAQLDRHLPRLLTGAAGATAISEKGTGTEVRALETRLTREGNGYRLDGHKYNISHAPDAQLVLVVAAYTSEDKPATALVLLDPTRDGVSRTVPQETFGVADLRSATSRSRMSASANTICSASRPRAYAY